MPKLQKRQLFLLKMTTFDLFEWKYCHFVKLLRFDNSNFLLSLINHVIQEPMLSSSVIYVPTCLLCRSKVVGTDYGHPTVKSKISEKLGRCGRQNMHRPKPKNVGMMDQSYGQFTLPFKNFNTITKLFWHKSTNFK